MSRIEALEASVRLRVSRHRRMPRICLARSADVPCCETYMELCPVCVRSLEQQSSKRYRQFNQLKAKRLTGAAAQKPTATPVKPAQAVKARARDWR
jgi:hypothetical protein